MRSIISVIILAFSAMHAKSQNIWTSPIALATRAMFMAETACGTTVHFAYGQKSKIMYRRSVNGGLSWSTAVQIGSEDEIPLDRALACDGNNVYIAYALSNNLYVRRSMDNGTTWSTGTLISSGPGSSYFFRLTIRALAGKVHLVWAPENSSNFSTTGLYYARSLDAGVTWQPYTQLLPGTYNPGRPSMAVNGSNVYLTYAYSIDGNPPCYTWPACPQSYLQRSTDGGTTWLSPQRLSNTPCGTLIRQDVTALDDGSTVVTSWQDDGCVNGQEEVYTDRSTDAGATFAGAVRMTFSPQASEHAAIDSLGQYVSLVWFDRRDGNEEIYYIQSNDLGVTWAPEQRLTNSSTSDSVPRLALTPNRVHLIWNLGGSTFEYISSALNGL